MKSFAFLLSTVAFLFINTAFANGVGAGCRVTDIVIKNNLGKTLVYKGASVGTNWSADPLETVIPEGATGSIIISYTSLKPHRQSAQGYLYFSDSSNKRPYMLAFLVPIELKPQPPEITEAHGFHPVMTSWKVNPIIHGTCLDDVQENVTIHKVA